MIIPEINTVADAHAMLDPLFGSICVECQVWRHDGSAVFDVSWRITTFQRGQSSGCQQHTGPTLQAAFNLTYMLGMNNQLGVLAPDSVADINSYKDGASENVPG